MVVAGLEQAFELAQLAMEETGFGVLEDKVVKNYIATEFLYDYLKDKPSVGVIETDPERGIELVAEPIGVVLALYPLCAWYDRVKTNNRHLWWLSYL